MLDDSIARDSQNWNWLAILRIISPTVTLPGGAVTVLSTYFYARRIQEIEKEKQAAESARQEEARLREEEARLRQEAEKGQQEEARLRQEETRRREEETRRREEETRRREEEARLRQEEARLRQEAEAEARVLRAQLEQANASQHLSNHDATERE